MLVVAGAVVWFAPVRRGFEFIGERRCPLFPCEVALCGKPHREREGLGLPRLGKDGAAFVTRERGQSSDSLGVRLQFRRAQGSYPTCQGKQNLAVRRYRPTIPALQNAPNTSAEAAPQEDARSYPGAQICRGGER